jgi:hypothetical protein
LPDEWEQHADREVLRLVPLAPDSPEFLLIQNNMRRSMPKAADCIKQIDRVQNVDLWRSYSQSRRIIAETRCGAYFEEVVSRGVVIAAHEVLAWHSTGPSTDPRLIYAGRLWGFNPHISAIEPEYHADGRDTTYHKQGSKAYGTGTYFSKHPIYGDAVFPHTRPADDAEHPAFRQILLAKVTLGDSFDHGDEIPARRPANAPDGCHSRQGTENQVRHFGKHLLKLKAAKVWRADHPMQQLVDNGEEFGRQYVIHDKHQAYPAYLVTYSNPNAP